MDRVWRESRVELMGGFGDGLGMRGGVALLVDGGV